MDKEEITVGYQTLGSASVSSEEGDAYFFSGPELNQRLDLLRHLTVNSERIPLVQGQAGVGKSTILNQFQIQAPDSWLLCRIDANLMLQPEQLFSLLAKGFGVEVNDERVIERLIHRFEDLHREGRLPVILVDDAHLLPVATIISLLRVHERHPESHALVRVLLFASPQIDELLKTPQIQAMNLQSLQRLDLSPLNQEQTEQMIHQMLLRRGLTDQLELTPGQLEKIYRDTGGLPGEIVHQLDRLLREPASQPSASTHRPRSLLTGLSMPTLAGAILVSIVLLLTLWYEDEINALFQGKKEPEEMVSLPPVANETLVPLELPEPQQLPKEEEVFLAEGGSGVTAKSGSGSKLALPEVNADQERGHGAESSIGAPETVVPTPDQAPGVSETAAIETKTLSLVPATAFAPEVPPDASMDRDRWSLAVPLDSKFSDTLMVRQPPEASATGLAGDNSAGQSEVTEESRIPAAETPPSRQAEEQGSAGPALPLPPVLTEEPRSAAKAGVVVDEAPKKIAAKDLRVADADRSMHTEAWLLRQNPSAYTLQLIGVQEEEAVERFVRSHQLGGNVASFRSIRDGRAWFSVVYGIYPDRDAAVAGRSQLPASLRAAGVWPRSLASVHQAIQENRKPNP